MPAAPQDNHSSTPASDTKAEPGAETESPVAADIDPLPDWLRAFFERAGLGDYAEQMPEQMLNRIIEKVKHDHEKEGELVNNLVHKATRYISELEKKVSDGEKRVWELEKQVNKLKSIIADQAESIMDMRRAA
ncbi:hypothetical protein QBC32DRAFT_220916 [Pseudoneurospora amorphoporcata]|uniref:Uncharacterized protein n=1 Tax=Pseudoneurospora amorphoporcata TaxID=241081 RepID=A0AAN6NPW8_9PEZI|nr:hypothetical protein QBC32DRAFT_220916 [Pseudoneurospora amorphoporcata]